MEWDTGLDQLSDNIWIPEANSYFGEIFLVGIQPIHRVLRGGINGFEISRICIERSAIPSYPVLMQ